MKNRKKVLSVLFILTLLVGVLTGVSFAETTNKKTAVQETAEKGEEASKQAGTKELLQNLEAATGLTLKESDLEAVGTVSGDGTLGVYRVTFQDGVIYVMASSGQGVAILDMYVDNKNGEQSECVAVVDEKKNVRYPFIETKAASFHFASDNLGKVTGLPALKGYAYAADYEEDDGNLTGGIRVFGSDGKLFSFVEYRSHIVGSNRMIETLICKDDSGVPLASMVLSHELAKGADYWDEGNSNVKCTITTLDPLMCTVMNYEEKAFFPQFDTTTIGSDVDGVELLRGIATTMQSSFSDTEEVDETMMIGTNMKVKPLGNGSYAMQAKNPDESIKVSLVAVKQGRKYVLIGSRSNTKTGEARGFVALNSRRAIIPLALAYDINGNETDTRYALPWFSANAVETKTTRKDGAELASINITNDDETFLSQIDRMVLKENDKTIVSFTRKDEDGNATHQLFVEGTEEENQLMFVNLTTGDQFCMTYVVDKEDGIDLDLIDLINNEQE